MASSSETPDAYERIAGRVYFSVAVANPHNQRIVDLKNAVNLHDGQVEFSADFVAIHPKDARKATVRCCSRFPIAAVPASYQLSMAEIGMPRMMWVMPGCSITALLSSASVGSGTRLVPMRCDFYAPIAKDNGRTITGLLRGDLMLSQDTPEIPLGHLTMGNIGGTEYAVSAPDDARNALTVRDSREAERTVVPRSEWQFAHTVDGKIVPSDRHIHLNGGFHAGKIYEYVYVVADPVVAGLGFAAIRDFASYAKHDSNAITPAERIYGEGISQNGRFLRDLLYEGFNADEDGKIALDGVLAHVAGAGRGSFNYRFAQPSRDAQPTSSIFFPTDVFPFTDLPERDPATGVSSGILDRAAGGKGRSQDFLSNTSYEYWGRVAALTHVSIDGKSDAKISDNVRIYHFTGLQHFSGPFPPAKGQRDLLGQEPQSPLPVRYFWRSMIANMDAWVRSDAAPAKQLSKNQ